MSQPHARAATLDDLYLGCAAQFVPDVPIPHQLIADGVRGIHGRGEQLTIDELATTRDRLIRQRKLHRVPGVDEVFVTIDRKVARQAPTSESFNPVARLALEHALLQFLSERQPGTLPPQLDQQLERVIRWSLARSDHATATLCAFVAIEYMARALFARVVELMRRSLDIDPIHDDPLRRRLTLTSALLRLGRPAEAAIVMAELNDPSAPLAATQAWADALTGFTDSGLHPLPWSCVPDDLVYILGGTPAFQEAYRASTPLIAGAIYNIKKQIIGPATGPVVALFLPQHPEATLIAQQRAAQAAVGGESGDVTTMWDGWFVPERGGFLRLNMEIEAPIQGKIQFIFLLDDPETHALLRHIDATNTIGFLVEAPRNPDPFDGARITQYLVVEVIEMPDAARAFLRRPPPRRETLEERPARGKGTKHTSSDNGPVNSA